MIAKEMVGLEERGGMGKESKEEEERESLVGIRLRLKGGSVF